MPLLRLQSEAALATAVRPQLVFFGGYLLAPIVGYLVLWVGLARGLRIGCGAVALGLVSLGLCLVLGRAVLLLPSVFLVASGVIFIQVTVTPMLFRAGPERGGAGRISLGHGIRTIGVLSIPALATAFVFGGQAASGLTAEAVTALSVIALTLALPLVFFALSGGGGGCTEASVRQPAPALLSLAKTVGPIVAIVFVAVGIEIVAASFVVIAAVEDTGLGGKGGALLLLVFWLGFLVTRLSAAFLLRFARPETLLAAACVGTTAILVAGGLLPVGYSAYIIAALGIVLGPVIPLALARLTAAAPRAMQGVLFGFLCLSFLGGGVVPTIYAEIVDRSTFVEGFRFLGIMMIIPLIIALALARRSGNHFISPEAQRSPAR